MNNINDISRTAIVFFVSVVFACSLRGPERSDRLWGIRCFFIPLKTLNINFADQRLDVCH